jgi:hypothetical protein
MLQGNCETHTITLRLTILTIFTTYRRILLPKTEILLRYILLLKIYYILSIFQQLCYLLKMAVDRRNRQ